MSCCNCRWSSNEPILFEILEDFDGIRGIEPERGTEKSSGIDVFVPKGYNAQILPGKDHLIPLRLRVMIPEGFDLEVKNKSGISTRLKLVKGAQLIDEDYRGELKLHLFNLGPETAWIHEGMKIAQLVLRPVYRAKIEIVDSIDTETERGENGFGSTGFVK